MAECSVQSAVQCLGKLLVEEKENLQAIEQKVEQLRDELDWMQCFLREADPCRNVDPRISRWVIQIQGIAFEAEDIVESFLVKVLSHQNQHHTGKTSTLKNALERYLWVVKEAKAIHDASNDIEALRVKVSTLTSRLQAYGVGITRSECWKLESTQPGIDVFKEDKIVGLDDKVKQIVGDLVSKATENKFFGIWGKNGIGKTTFAAKVYFHFAVRRHFDRFVWLNVPENCKIVDLLRKLWSSLGRISWDEVEMMNEQVLVKEIFDVMLEKKCLVIIDDVWSKEIWDGLKEAFPGDDERDSRSKILFTTQSSKVAEEMHQGAVVRELRCLSYDESWELLRTKLGDFTGTHAMTEMAKNMLKSCQGIPLAVIALGGLLAATKTPEKWKILLDHITVNNGDQSYEKVLELCYYNLPYYLKNCFLFLGNFPQHYEIHVKRLCHMWVAQGITVLENGDVENFAEYCLNELLQRGMVQVAKRGSTDKIRSCRLHKIMRDLCFQVSKEENLGGKTRQFALYLGEDEESSFPMKNPFLRCLQLFPSTEKSSEMNYMSLKSFCKDSPLIRVLDLEGVSVSTKTLPREIGDLLYLRYLNLKGMPLTKLPPTIGSLRWVETLDLRAKVRLEIPNVLWRLTKLRHLYLPCYFTVKDSEKLRLDSLTNLLTLKNANHFLTEDVLGMKFLKRASIRYISENEHVEFMQKSPEVTFSLTIFQAVISEQQVNVLQHFQNLIKLELKGGLSAPMNKLIFPSNMQKLLLDFCGLIQDPMPILEKLPNLACLCFDHQAYMGQNMICSSSGFPRLSYLRFNGLKNLEEFKVEKGAMPHLRQLEVKNCERLTKIPDGIPQQVLVTLE
ncbi:putative disease resistance protein At1g50180 [Silene latifolia]|uniref:putative disease resistance protein At1g50180 n=1 Tax=Silene latifolia TaxID=37657 RepID=UPI003D785EDB